MKHLTLLATTILLASCASVYDETRVFYDEVQQKTIVTLSHPRLCEQVNWIPLLVEGPVGDCPVNSYSLVEASDTITLDVMVYSYGGFDPKNIMVEGKIVEIVRQPVRVGVSFGNRISFNADTYERFSVSLPLNDFVKWSCRDRRVLLRVSGKYDLDVPLAIEPIRQFLAKAEDMLQLRIEAKACLSRETNA